MTAHLISKHGSWREVADCARVTVGKDAGTGEPSSSWKRRILLAEHSPIRNMSFVIELRDLKSWVSVHFVRHKIGVEHFVSTQRTDRTGVNRDELPQDELVTHRMIMNAQAMVNISRKRLCRCASNETRAAWLAIIETIKESETELYNTCVSECVYRGFCPEFKSCGYSASSEYAMRVKLYREVGK